jgi:hypothetical protein
MALSLVGLGLWLAAPAAPAQEARPPLRLPFSSPGKVAVQQPVKTLRFTKPPDPPPPLRMAPAPAKTIQLSKEPTTGVPPQPGLFPAIQPAAMQQPGGPRPPAQGPDMRAPGETQDYQIQLEPPGPQRLFRVESEAALHERMRQEARERPRPERLDFPEYRPISTEPHAFRSWPQQNLWVEPNYVCHRRLEFEQINSERYGWEISYLQPLISATHFYFDLATLPYHAFTEPCRRFECSAGYCLPGDPVPLLLYPPQLSLTGAAAQAGAIVALIAIFP